MEITKGTHIEHYSCGNLVSAVVVFAGGKKIVTRHEPQTMTMGDQKHLTVIVWSKERKRPLPLAYLNGERLNEKQFVI